MLQRLKSCRTWARASAATVLASACLAGAALAAPAPAYDSMKDFEAMKAAAGGGTRITYATMPDWTGVWRTKRGGRRNLADLKLTPKYRAAEIKSREEAEKGNEWDRMGWCLPVGMPRWLTDPFLREFIVTPNQTWLLNEQLNETRRVYTDGRAHIPESVAIPLWEGDSIGFWDKDTLVIHTTHLKAGEYGRNTAAYSFKTSTVERWRLIDPKTIKVELTVYDPESLLEPWKSEALFGRVEDPETRVSYASCEEGNNAIRTPQGGTDYLLPGDPGYRDPVTFGIPEVALDSMPK